MKTLFSLSVMMIVSSIVLNAQTIMNIHQSNGAVLQIPLNTIDSITYSTGNPGNLATLVTLPVENIISFGATSGGNITNDGGSTITQRGLVWDTISNPTLESNFTVNGIGTGVFSSNLTGLNSNTTYYIRAYAVNSAGISYGNEINFTTIADNNGLFSMPGAGVEYYGYNYPSVILGNGQEWMSENLRTAFYSNGDPILNLTNDSQWSMNFSGSWCYYNHDNQFENLYGKLYNWYAIDDSRNVCPTGWHVPTDTEWNTLVFFIDNSFDPTIYGVQSSTAGGILKSEQVWQSPNTGATNQIDFSGLPGGARGSSGAFVFNSIGAWGYYWTATELNSTSQFAWQRTLYYYNSSIIRDNQSKASGRSVRCIRD
jgi:uncharacterized protein (TIGR02145 family)